MNHWISAPILVPALAGAAMLLAGEPRLGLQRALGIASCAGLVLIATIAVGSRPRATEDCSWTLVNPRLSPV